MEGKKLLSEVIIANATDLFPLEFAEINTDLHIWKVFCLLNTPVTVKNFSLPGVASYFSPLISNSLPTCFPYPAFLGFLPQTVMLEESLCTMELCTETSPHLQRARGCEKISAQSKNGHRKRSQPQWHRAGEEKSCLQIFRQHLLEAHKKHCDLREINDGFTD